MFITNHKLAPESELQVNLLGVLSFKFMDNAPSGRVYPVSSTNFKSSI